LPPPVAINGIPPPIMVRVNRRAKRLSVKVRPPDGTVELVLPEAGARAAGLAFLATQADWIARQRARLPQPVRFAVGAEIPFRGQPHLLTHDQARRGVVQAISGEDGRPALRVSGPEAHFARRLTDWLKAQARADLTAAVDRYADIVGCPRGKISIRDTRSQWGSCSARGALSFSWRLILAPGEVAAYVAAHETAHLRHRNHGPAFWQLVDELCPDQREQRAWLRQNGKELHRFN
jgi:predicted metal-dependent hydrolase